MKKIRQFVAENMDYLNQEEPSKDHFRRFEDRLRLHHQRRLNFKVISYAASIIVLIGLTFIFRNQFVNGNVKLSNELAEIETFYEIQIVNQLELIREDKYLNEKEIENELEKFDLSVVELKIEYQKNPYNSRIRDAIIHHFQLKLEIVDLILEQAKDIQI